MSMFPDFFGGLNDDPIFGYVYHEIAEKYGIVQCNIARVPDLM